MERAGDAMTASSNVYRYEALSTEGQVVRGEVLADSEDAARLRLADRGELPIRLAPRIAFQRARGRLPVADLAVGLRLLADLLSAGLPMTRALDLFAEVAPARWMPALGPIREAVREGQTLAGAMADCPLALPPLVIGIVRAGEAGDGIAEAMRRAAAHAEASAAAASALRSALAYPMVVAVTGLASVAAMVGIVLPRFALILADIGQELPAMTQLVLGTADLARAALLPAAALAGFATFLVQGRLRSPAGRQQLHAALLALPLLGRLRHSASTSRLATALAALVGSGVPIPVALRLASRAVGDEAVSARVGIAMERIRAGESLARALAAESAVTPIAIRLIRTGEESGRLQAMLDHAGAMERDRVHRAIQAGVRALEPILILVFAALVGTVAIALLQAVYAVRPL